MRPAVAKLKMFYKYSTSIGMSKLLLYLLRPWSSSVYAYWLLVLHTCGMRDVLTNITVA